LVQASTSASTFRLNSAVNYRLRGFAVTSVTCTTNPFSAVLT